MPSSARLMFARIEVFWWVIPTSTMAFSVMAMIGLVFCQRYDSPSGYRSAGKWFRSTMLRQSCNKDTFIQTSNDISNRFTLMPPTPPLPVHLSGWDDSLRSIKSKPKPPALTCNIPLVPTSPSESESESEADASFKASTLAYLQSPTGRETFRRSPTFSKPLSPPPAATAPRWSSLLATPPPALAPISVSTSPSQSILSSPWPRPPSAVPVSPSRSPVPSSSSPQPSLQLQPVARAVSRRYARPPSTSSFTGSIASSTISANAYVSDPDIFLHSVTSPTYRPPFQDSGIPADGIDIERASSPTRSARRIPSIESFHARNLSLKRGNLQKKKEIQGDGIYMTVVQETQAF